MLNTLGPGAHNAHIALDDIENLGQFIDTGGPNDSANLGDSGVVICCGDRLTFFFRIHDHTSEFEDIKFLSIPGSTFLLEENGAAVFHLDGNGSNSHNGCRHDHSNQANNQIQHALGRPLCRGQALALYQQQRGIKQVDLCSTPDNDIRQLWRHIGPQFMLIAELQNIISQVSGNVTDDHRIVFYNFLTDLFQTGFLGDQLGDVILIGADVHFQLQHHSLFPAKDHDHVLRNIELVIKVSVDKAANKG